LSSEAKDFLYIARALFNQNTSGISPVFVFAAWRRGLDNFDAWLE
jgi:hypothetical protein